jgi:hypothetical protein
MLLTKLSYGIRFKGIGYSWCYAAAKCRTWVGQLTVGWRVGKARERGNVCSSVWQGFIAASQLAHNVSSVYEVNFANTKLNMKCKQGI